MEIKIEEGVLKAALEVISASRKQEMEIISSSLERIDKHLNALINLALEESRASNARHAAAEEAKAVAAAEEAAAAKAEAAANAEIKELRREIEVTKLRIHLRNLKTTDDKPLDA